ncbi:MAG: hypothetical protein JO040_02080 [Gemmatimonadetes bacterium]|nr:hypothetical protein [Gemmatimonadota bacterium]
MRTPILLTLSAFLLAAHATLGVAQETEARPAAPADTLRRADLPRDVADRIVDFFNDPETLHFSGRTRIPEERAVSGDVAVLGGPLTVAGHVQGRVVVINGDVELLPGAVIDGDLTVVGGEITGVEVARIGGQAVAYSEPLRYSHDGDRISHRERRVRLGARTGESAHTEHFGRGSFTVTTGKSYNRVEGLPIQFGPTIETGGRNPFRVSALAIYRTESGPFFETERWGHDVTAEQFLGGHRAFRVGAGVHSVVSPIEAWHVSDTESALSTFLFHRDFRDHYERKGWRAFATLEPRGTPYSLTAEYRSERHSSLAVGDPWTVFNSTGEWRPQPLVGEGRLNSLVFSGRFDTRNETDDPSTGWFIRGQVEHALDSGLERPAAYVAGPFPFDGRIAVPAVPFDRFTTGTLDIRRYNRVDPESRLNFRLLLGGALTGSALPPQRQHALGGEGSLPGYSLFQLDCGARFSRVYRAADVPFPDADASRAPVFVPAYGCDRFALFQSEYRGNLAFHFGWGGHSWNDEGEDDDRSWNGDLDWVLFADAGRGWVRPGSAGMHDEPTAVDAGVGLVLDQVGVYAAVPLRNGHGVNLFIRLGTRF